MLTVARDSKLDNREWCMRWQKRLSNRVRAWAPFPVPCLLHAGHLPWSYLLLLLIYYEDTFIYFFIVHLEQHS